MDKCSNTYKLGLSLLNLGAVTINTKNPFTWASGIKSPIYCNNRLIMSDVSIRELVTTLFEERIRSLKEKDILIAGTATAGIPHAAFLAWKMRLPMIYVRTSEKKHGLKQQIEGIYDDKDKCVLIEDLISTGQSSISAAKTIMEAGPKVLSVLSIFTYGFKSAVYNFETEKLNYSSLISIQDLMIIAENEGKISKEERTIVDVFLTSN